MDSSYEEYLAQHGFMKLNNADRSMAPMLTSGWDVFTIERKGEERFRKYDVIFYARPNGMYVLRRIVKVLPDGYVTLADSGLHKEYGVKDETVLGKMTSYLHDGKEHAVTEPRYRLYSRVRVLTAPVRILLHKLRSGPEG